MSAYPAWSDRPNGRRVRIHSGSIRHVDAPSDGRSTIVAPADWLAAIGRRWRGGTMPHLAQQLAELADPDTGVITLDSAALRRLLNQVRLVLPGLKRLLDILVAHGYLAPTDPAPGQKLGSYQLALRGGRDE